MKHLKKTEERIGRNVVSKTIKTNILNDTNSPIILNIDGTLTGTPTRDHSRLESNGDKGVLHTCQISRSETSPPDSLMSYPGYERREKEMR